jgi:hypothetical protein
MLHPVRLLSVPAGAWRRLKRVATLYGVTERLRLKKNTAFWAILGCIWLYTLFVDASATVIRGLIQRAPKTRSERTSACFHPELRAFFHASAQWHELDTAPLFPRSPQSILPLAPR